MKRSLERHHLEHLSAGGSNDEANLIMLCPLCHAIVHQHQNLYPLEKLKRLKAHWAGMASVVAPDLVLESNDEPSGQAHALPVQLALDRLGLLFRVTAPASTKVNTFLDFVARQILSPLDRYTGGAFLQDLDEFSLTHRNDRSERFDANGSLQAITLADDDAFTIYASTRKKRHLMPVLVRVPTHIEISPKRPAALSTYSVTVTGGRIQGGGVAYVWIRGTDGLSATWSADATAENGESIRVQAGAQGVVHTIDAEIVGDDGVNPGRGQHKLTFA
jgi:hypothetical protein